MGGKKKQSPRARRNRNVPAAAFTQPWSDSPDTAASSSPQHLARTSRLARAAACHPARNKIKGEVIGKEIYLWTERSKAAGYRQRDRDGWTDRKSQAEFPRAKLWSAVRWTESWTHRAGEVVEIPGECLARSNRAAAIEDGGSARKVEAGKRTRGPARVATRIRCGTPRPHAAASSQSAYLDYGR